jgi:hypothetical protein
MSKLHVRLAFLSDLHAYNPTSGKAGPSFLPANPNPSDPNPFRDLEQLVDREKLNVDLIICGGDICDKADFLGFQYAWKQLHNLKEKLNATQLVVTCGNHDLNSRIINISEDPDPKGALQTLSPKFPFEDEVLSDRFWSRNYVLIEPLAGIQILVLNTSAYHGGADNEIDHGRVSRRTIDAIKKELQASSSKELNILLCHHHIRPLRGLWGTSPDGEYIKKGGELLDELTKCTASPWLTLHGHRHIPNLEFTIDPSSVVIGASSFSAQMHGSLNQFHILDIEVDLTDQTPFRGMIETWSWNLSNGWQQRRIENDSEGFPPTCGFGSTILPRAMASRIESLVNASAGFLEWAEVVQQIPEIQFTTPSHFRQVENLLAANNISLNLSKEGKAAQIGKRK